MSHPIDIAAEIVGSQAALASALGVSNGAVSQWKETGRRVPAEHCPAIEQLTGKRVRCEDLRPDIAWSVLREQTAPKRKKADAPQAADRALAYVKRVLNVGSRRASDKPNHRKD